MGARLLILGLDGATWDVLDPLGARLPHLTRLWREGVRAPLNSTRPPMTLPAWSSVLTGVNPGRHGILDFVRRVPGTYRLELLNATHRRVPTLHQLLSTRGRRVASIAVPTTWPPDRLNGVMISGFDSPVATSIEASHCEPPGLYDEILARFGGLRFADFQEGDIGGGWHEAARASLLREIGRKEALCRTLLQREDWQAFMVVFGESDTVAHHFWMFHDPRSPRYTPGWAHVLAEVYERLDAVVGLLARQADNVCVVSDHGFGGAGDVVVYLNRFLEARGWLRYRAGRRGAGGDHLRRLALRLPAERIIRRVPDAWLGGIESRTRYGDIDFTATRAWSDEMNYAATIHLNVRGRDPDGTIEDVEAATRALTRELLAWEVEGVPVVARVWRREECVRGPAADGAPDLILELALRGGYSVTVLPSSRVSPGTVWRRLLPAEHVGGKGLGMNGSHRQHGVLILNGPAFRRGVATEADVIDVLPTVLHALGEAVPDHVEGRVLEEALAGPEPVERVTVAASMPRPRPYGSAQSDAVRRRLERLGYL